MTNVLSFLQKSVDLLLSHEGSSRQNDDPGNCIYIVVTHKCVVRKGPR